MSQDAYNIDQPVAFAGLKGDASYDRVETGLAEGAIGFGLGLEAGTDPEKQVKVPSAPGGVVRGISVHQHVEKTLGTGVAQYEDEDAVGVMRQGLIWMRQETSDIGTLAIDDPVYINVAIGGAQLGRVTSVSTGNVLIPTGVCRKLSTDPDGFGIALIEINIP